MEKRYEDIFRFHSVGNTHPGMTSHREIISESEIFVGKRRLIQSEEEVKKIFAEFHSSPFGGHAGINQTQSAVCSRLFWHRISKDIRNWIEECEKCQKVGKPLAALQPLQCIKVSSVWELVGIALTGPLPKTEDGFQLHFDGHRFLFKVGGGFSTEDKDRSRHGTPFMCDL